MNKNKIMAARIAASVVLFVCASLFFEGQINFIMFFAAYLIAGYDVVWGAVRNILKGQVFDENFLMSIATVGAFAVGEYAEGAAVMIFFQIGEMFQDYAVNKSRKNIAKLMDIKPEYANIMQDGKIVKLNPEKVNVGDIIVVNPGEKIPLDGVVMQGESRLDTAALTGESLPVFVSGGDEVFSGSINTNGVIHIKATKEYKNSTVSRILFLAENASNRKSKSEKFITRFAAYYTPVVVICAVALAVLPPLILKQSFSDWLYRALIFLVISCPCALVISVPLSFFGGLGGASARGILIKGSNYLENLSKVKTVVFDKTGTLTKGRFSVVGVNSTNSDSSALLTYAAAAESFSNHPIARCIKDAAEQKPNLEDVKDVKETAGGGVQCTYQNSVVLAGSGKFLRDNGIDCPDDADASVVYIAKDGQYMGNIQISDTVKQEAESALRGLKNLGVKQTVMLTGDNKATGEAIGKAVGIDKVYAKLLPQDKVNILEQVITDNKEGKVCYVGDGINDAPVLARSDVGVAMGAFGSDAAIEAADVVIMNDELDKLVTAVKISRKTMGIVKQNIVFALGVKFLVMLMGAFGVATMWDAVFADVGVAVIAILNAMRALNTKNM